MFKYNLTYGHTGRMTYRDFFHIHSVDVKYGLHEPKPYHGTYNLETLQIFIDYNDMYVWKKYYESL